MLSRFEFHTALCLALAALSPPEPDEAPIVGEGKVGLDNVCFDFWPGDSLRIVGTNGRRLVVVYATVPGLPKAGKFLMPIESVQEALCTFAPDPIPAGDRARVQFSLFGLESMIITSGEDAQMVTGSNHVMYPEYHIMLNDTPNNANPPPYARGAVFDMGTLAWVLKHAPLVGHVALAAQLRGYGVSTFRPKLREEFQAIHDVVFAIKPLAVTT